MGALNRVLSQMLPYVPRAIVGRVSARYIAGEKLQEALDTVASLNATGTSATVDILGEFVRALPEASAAREEYVGLVQALADRALDSQVSVKLTQLGLKIDRGVCLEHMRAIAAQAQRLGNLVAIDMEDSSCTDATLEIYEALRHDNRHVGAVLQACLRRSRADLERLLPLEPNVRVCKGIYVEPVEIAYQKPERIRQSFLDLVEMLLTRTSFVGIATHDEILVDASSELLRKHRTAPERYEFQMLLGVRHELRSRLLAQGHPVRVYVPYGRHWYAYSMRRLKENPAIAGHVFRNLFERV
ncbi:MAG: proline dehydrogenase family protein [Candidatus Latescibacterota bacterium]|nr:MAG: proline dehydrogenase family protein [Candidatus Latescibacterota bacterium]